VEIRQPWINAQYMTYTTNTTYPLENQWDRNTQGGTERIKHRYFNQIYDLEDGDLPPERNRYPEESETAGDAATCKAIGPLRHRPFQNLEDRMQTMQTGKVKACLRCRMQKIRVPNPHLQLIILQATNGKSSAILTLQIQGGSV
jgi:hypothetical protein